MVDTIERAAQVISNLEQSLAQARSENNYLRRQVDGRHPYHRTTAPRILRRAHDDAMSILVLRAGGYAPSRRYCYGLGMSERRYTWALGLLRSARVVSARGYAWLVDDFNTAEVRVKAEHARLTGQVNALEMLRIYLPAKMQYTYGDMKR